jgi:PKD repeat protein
MRVCRWGLIIGLVLVVGMVSGCGLFNAAPVVNFTWAPFEPLARTDVRFTDASTDAGGLFGGGGIVSWNWDFGDNNSSTSQNPTHRYDRSENYNVRLTVMDGSGQSSTITKMVAVTPSIAGTWRGQIVNPGGWTDAIEVVFTQSSSGGIQGTAYYMGMPFPCSSISFNPVAKRIEFQLIDLGIRLDGTLDGSETRISGFWYVLGAPLQGFGWDVTRQ